MEEHRTIGVVRVVRGDSSDGLVQVDPETFEVSLIEQSKSRTFIPDLAFPPSVTDLEASSAVLSTLDVPSLLTSSRTVAILTYGPRDCGKSSLLFSEDGLLAAILSSLSEAMEASVVRVLISASEVVYAESAATEVWVDLLGSQGESARKVGGWVEVGTDAEAREAVRIAQSRSASWEDSEVLLNSRGHTFLSLMLCSPSTQSLLSLVDLAGFQPAKASSALRAKLPGDKQLMFTRMGLMNLRSFLRNWAEGKELEANHSFKVVSGVEEAFTGAEVLFIVGLREDTGFADAVNALELMEVVKSIDTGDEVERVEPETVQRYADLIQSRIGKTLQPASPHSTASPLHSDSPLKPYPTFNLPSHPDSPPDTDPSDDLKSEETKDWLSQFDARLSRILSRSSKTTPKPAVSEASNRALTFDSLQISQLGGEDENEAEIARLREDCYSMEAQTTVNGEESVALLRHVAGLEDELQSLTREISETLTVTQKENEALAGSYSAALAAKGGKSVEDVYSEDFAVLEEQMQRVADLTTAVRVMAEQDVSERNAIKMLKGMVAGMTSEVEAMEGKIAGMKIASRKWDMAEKCYTNVRRHVSDLEAELKSFEDKIHRQESKAESLMLELLQEKERCEELTRARGEAQMEGSKLTLLSVRQKHVISLRSSPGNVSLTTNAGAGGVQKSIRLLQDALRKAGSVQEMSLASQLLSQVQTLTEELRKRKTRTRNMSAKVKRLQTSPKEGRPKVVESSVNSSEGKIPKFSFS